MKFFFILISLALGINALGVDNTAEKLMNTLPGTYEGKSSTGKYPCTAVIRLEKGMFHFEVSEDGVNEGDSFKLSRRTLLRSFSEYGQKFYHQVKLSWGGLWTGPETKSVGVYFRNIETMDPITLLGVQIIHNEEHEMFSVPVQHNATCWNLKRVQ